MEKQIICIGMLIIFALMPSVGVYSQEDMIIKVAIDTLKSQVQLPQGTEIKFLEKKESLIPEFYSVKLLIGLPDKEIPVIVYVDKSGEKVILGSLFVKGENVTMKEVGPPKLRKIDMKILEMEKSPFLGNKEAKVTIVEFANFQCSYCMDSWGHVQRLMQKYSKDILYIFKHFPFQFQGRTFELSEMAAAAQEINDEAFWAIHDFFFTDEGQNIAKLEKNALKQKVEQLLKGKGYDIKIFQSALDTGKAKKRVLDDMALGNKLRVMSTPTKIVNGDMIVGSSQDHLLERYLIK